MRRSSYRRPSKNSRGAALAETAAALALFLPTVIFIIFVVLEVSYAYFLKSALSEAAREGARDLAIAYGLDNTIAATRSAQDTKVFNNIRINNVVNASSQFANPVWTINSDPTVPSTVTVQVNYTSGTNGLPVFPNPDPLHVANYFALAGTSTFRLQ